MKLSLSKINFNNYKYVDNSKVNFPIWITICLSTIFFCAGKFSHTTTNLFYNLTTNLTTSMVVISSGIFAITFIFFLTNKLFAIAKYLSILGFISSILCFFNDSIYELGFTLSSFSFLLLSIISLAIVIYFFPLKQSIIYSIFAYGLMESSAILLKNSLLNITPLILNILILLCSAIFMFSICFFSPKKINITFTKTNNKNSTDSALPKIPNFVPYTVVIITCILIVFSLSITTIKNLFYIQNNIAEIVYYSSLIISSVITIYVVFKLGYSKFFILLGLLLYLSLIGFILMYFSNEIIKYIGCGILGLTAMPLIILPVYSIILFKRVNKKCIPIIIVFLYILSLILLDQIESLIRNEIAWVTICIVTIFVFVLFLNFIRPIYRLILEDIRISVSNKNDTTNPFSYLNENELQCVQYIADGYSFNQIIELLYLTPKEGKTMKHLIYSTLHVKTKLELLSLIYLYYKNNKKEIK